MNTVKLSSCEVDIKPSLTWLESQEIEAILTGGAKMDSSGLKGFEGASLLEAKMKTMEIMIVEIREADKTFKFNREWVARLDVNDGNALMQAIDDVTKPKKK